MPVNSTIQFRKGSSSLWSSTNPILASGEPGYDTTNSVLKIGDGSTAWSSLSGVSKDEIEEYVLTTNLPSSGNINTVYRTTDDGRIYQWTGSTYAELGPDTSTTGAHASQHQSNGTDPIPLVEYVVSQLSANTNNLAHNNSDILYLTTNSNNLQLTGLVAPAFCCVKLIVNLNASNSIVLTHQSTNSDPANRFISYTASNYSLLAGYSISALYDTASARWRLL